MSMQFEGRLGVVEFGRQLVTTEDLDPVYSALEGTQMPPAQMARWLLAYWCYYHVGVACHAAEQSVSGFWAVMHRAAANAEPTPIGTRWPRAAERRHFRGAFAVEAVRRLEHKHRDPYELVMHLGARQGDDGVAAADVMRRTKELHGFGDWISFKVADMLERVGRIPVRFTEREAMYETPTQGAMLAAESWWGPNAAWAGPEPVLTRLREELKDLRAPPRADRALGLQELETVLCKWKSHLNGHYTVGKDSVEVSHALQAWAPRSLLASRMHEALLARCPLARTHNTTEQGVH